MAERQTAIMTAFNGGEISPRAAGRTDLARYASSCDEMTGWLPLVQGGATAAPGTHYVEQAKGPCRFVEFEPYPTQGYILEFSDHALRFYTNDARIETAPGVPLTLATPWTYDEALTLDYQGSIDVLYLVGAGKPPYVLTRTGATSFTLAPYALRSGPFTDGNNDEDAKVAASGTTGSVSLSATKPIFVASDIGSLFELEAADFSDVPSWMPQVLVNAGDRRSWDGKVYQCEAGTNRTGTRAPTHDSGAEWDGPAFGTDINDKGPYGVKWRFLYGRHGMVRITGFTNAQTVTATVIKRLADSLTTTSSYRWTFGAFSATRGWPDAVTIWNECLTLFKGAEGFTSVVGSLDDFARRDSSGDFQHDLAGRFTLPSRDAVRWCAVDRVLLIGGTKAEYTCERVLTQTGAAGPPVFEVKLQATNGSGEVKPVQADGRMLFVQRAGRKVLEYAYGFQSDRYEAPDATRFAEHIGQPGFASLAWQQEPERLSWAAMGDGTLAALCYAPGDQVLAWARRELGAGLKARSVARITDPDGRRDQLWIAAETPDASWIVLRMAKIWEVGDDPRQAFFVDAGLSYEGPARTTLSGLTHLEGRTVDILADGKAHPQRTVAGGAVTLAYAASVVHIGAPYPARLTPVRPEFGQSEGTAQGKIKRVVGQTLRVVEASGLRIGVQGAFQVPVETRAIDAPLDRPAPLYTGDIAIDLIGVYDRAGQVTIERFQPVPATLTALVTAIEVGER